MAGKLPLPQARHRTVGLVEGAGLLLLLLLVAPKTATEVLIEHIERVLPALTRSSAVC